MLHQLMQILLLAVLHSHLILQAITIQLLATAHWALIPPVAPMHHSVPLLSITTLLVLITPLSVTMPSTPIPMATVLTLLSVLLRSKPTPRANITPLLVAMRSTPTPPAPITPLWACKPSTPTPLAPTTPLLASTCSSTTIPPPAQRQLGLEPPKAPPHIRTKVAHISGIRRDTPQARALTTTPFSGIRQDTASPPERITL